MPTKPLKHIVIGTDFSAGAGHAVRWGVDVARYHHAAVTLVHAIEGVAAADTDLQELVGHSLDMIRQRNVEAGIAGETIFRAGRPWEVLSEVAESEHADLLVVGARGQTAYSRILIGSVADRTIRQASTPVVVVHDSDVLANQSLGSALVGVDFSGESRQATFHAARLVSDGAGHGRLTLLHVWQPLVEYGFEESGVGIWINNLDRSIEQAEAGLERFADSARELGVEVETVVRQGYPAAILEQEIEIRHPDFVALGTRGRTGLSRFLMGSVAERIVHRSVAPVMTVRHDAALVAR